ncbi:accessory Sec system glycosyltransferase Asp1, partial [Staphylococcus aureus]|uniref:accessory Sec system glycosyltransferase Asp1 n=1 Tax=Staphylococcus aureus TaxID=1280 RepID=UPI001023B492
RQNADVSVSTLMTPDEQVDIMSVKRIHAENVDIETIRTFRLVLDMSKDPNMYLQISSISAGIPQINSQQTDYFSGYD